MVEVLGPVRPPTPPRTSSHTQENGPSRNSPAVFQTPNGAGIVENSSTGGPSTRSKRVNFSLSPKFIKPPTFTNSSKPQSDLRVLTPSNKCRPSKSILKTTQSPVPTSNPNVIPNTPESLAMLLESVIRQLAGESISSRHDAYMQLYNTLKAYEGVIGEQELSGKLGVITQFIQRDMTRNTGSVGPLEVNLSMHALMLCATLLWRSDISVRLPDDFKIFLVDHCISCLQDTSVPKNVLKPCMSVLSTQNFPAKIMTNTRIIRLLSGLHDLTKRVNGISIVSQRLSIYQRLLAQSKTTLVSHSALWMEHLITGLLHHEKETRLKALTFGFQVSIATGPNSALSKNLRDILNRPLDEGGELVSEVCGRLVKMMTHPDSGVHVPQAWSVIVLLLRSKNSSIDRWVHFRRWVLVIQECFNRPEPAIKAQAVIGWNRFVFAVGPSEPLNRNLLRMLRKPILSQFERKKQDKNGTQPTRLALCSYYNLLYYAFRPSGTYQHLDVAWEEFISGPASTIFASSPILSDRFAVALDSLLWSSQGKVWAENRAIETNRVEAVELPSIDCKWIRSRIASVLEVFESIFKSSVWHDTCPRLSDVACAWTSLSNALSHASSKEITPSAESVQAVSQVLCFLQRIWTAGPASLNAVGDQRMDNFFDRFSFLSTTIISSLGGIPFTEKLLLKNSDGTFQAANTPTHHNSQENSNLVTPIIHFLRLISDRAGMLDPSSSYSRLVDDALEAACNCRGSRSSRLELLRQCAELYPIKTGSENTSFPQVVWRATAKLVSGSLDSSPIEPIRERGESTSRENENIIKILSMGLKFSGVFQEWSQLLGSFTRVVASERGDRTIAATIVEPLAECLLHLQVPCVYLPLTTLIRHAESISYHQDVTNAEDGTSSNAHPTGTDKLFFPRKLMEIIDQTLRVSYENFNFSDADEFTGFIESFVSFLASSDLALQSAILETLKGSIAPWLKDEARKVNTESGVGNKLLTVVSIWSKNFGIF